MSTSWGLVSRGWRVEGTLSAGSDTWSRGVAVSSFELRSHQDGAGKCPSRRSRAYWRPTPRVFVGGSLRVSYDHLGVLRVNWDVGPISAAPSQARTVRKLS